MNIDKNKSKPSATLDTHVKRGDHRRRALFIRLREQILTAFPVVVENILNGYIGYGLDRTKAGRLSKTFLQIEVHSYDVLIYLRPIQYVDPRNIVTEADEKTGWTCNKMVRLYDEEEVGYAMKLISQSYQNSSDLKEASIKK